MSGRPAGGGQRPARWRGVPWFSKFAAAMPVHVPFRWLSLLPGLGFLHLLQAQPALSMLGEGLPDSVQVVGYAGAPEEGPVVFRALWTGMDGRTADFAMHWMRRPEPGQEVELVDLIMAGVDQYLDERIHFNRNGVTTSMPVPHMAEGIDRMIASTASVIGAAPVALSEPTRRQLARVCGIDWSQARFGVDGGEDQEKYMAIYYYVRAQRLELERNLHNDLAPLLGLRLMPAGEVAGVDPSRDVPVPTICTSVVDDDNYLCALDLQVDSTSQLADVRLTDTMLQEIADKANAAGPAEAAPRLRKRDRWLKAELDAINQRLDRTDQRKELWALRDRMDDIEGRLDDLGLQVDELAREREREKTPAMENAMAALSKLAGRNVQVHFSLGSAEIQRDGRALLDEVVRTMALSPGDRLLITGHADRSGDPVANLALSERRAKAVRSYLLARGIGAERLLLNYFGSEQGTGTGPAGRLVDLEWVR